MTVRYRVTGRDSFELVGSSGRKIDGMYGPDPKRPTMMALFAVVQDPTGAPFGIVREYYVRKRLGLAELMQRAEEFEEVAQARERGEESAAGVMTVDLTGRK